MIRRSLTYLLAALIALQSVVAMADAHQLHQSGSEHLAFVQQQDLAGAESLEVIELEVVDSANANSLDCQHCCHCHSMAHFYLGGSLDSLFTTALGNEISNYRFAYRSLAESPDNPPPIR